MKKRIKPVRPVAGVTIPLVISRIVDVPAEPAAKAPQPRQGKLNYLADRPKKKPSRPSVPARQRVEKRSYGVGQYLGDGKKLTGFVMLDPDEAPKTEAANDPED